jgi:Astacin (Peptidase family M12A)/Clostridial hydrophobic W
MMKKLLVIGASLIIMGFVACSQSNQPTSDVNASKAVLETSASKNDDLDTVDFETSSTGPEIDEDTKGKLKKPKARFNHKFSNGSVVALINSSSGETLLRTAHSQIVSQTKDLPDFISQHEKKIKDAGLGAKAVSVNQSGSAGAPWPGAVIPYIIDSGFSALELAKISKAIELWNENITVKYVPHSGQWDVVRIRPTDAGSKICQAGYTGKGPWFVSTYISNLQTIQLEKGKCAEDIGSILHEMAHTAGLYHEQQRCDRDNFINQTMTGLYDSQTGTTSYNVGALLNFGKLCWPLASDVEPFDYSSTMAYGYTTGTLGYVYKSGTVITTQVTIEPRSSVPAGNHIGNWTDLGIQSRKNAGLGILEPFLSQADVVALNGLYTGSSNAPAGQFAGKAHSSNVGWQNWVGGATYPATIIEIGSAGQNLEAVKLSTYRIRKNLMIAYQVHVSHIGWQDGSNYRANGELAGTTGRSLAIEAIKASLFGDSSGCNLTYRTKPKSGNWSAYTSDNTMSGSVGLGIPLEKIGLRLQCN